MIILPHTPEALLMDFDGVLTDNHVITDSEGVEYVRSSKLDSMGLSLLKKHSQIYIAVVTSERNKAPLKRCEKLKIDCHDAVSDKAMFLQALAVEKQINLARSIYVGNDINDLGALELVGLPVIVTDAHQSLHNKGFMTTSFSGGKGAIREVTEAILSTLED